MDWGPPGMEPGGPPVHGLLLGVLLVGQLHGADEHAARLLALVGGAGTLVGLELAARLALEEYRAADARLLGGGAVALARLLGSAAALGALEDLHHRGFDLAGDLVAAR